MKKEKETEQEKGKVCIYCTLFAFFAQGYTNYWHKLYMYIYKNTNINKHLSIGQDLAVAVTAIIIPQGLDVETRQVLYMYLKDEVQR